MAIFEMAAVLAVGLLAAYLFKRFIIVDANNLAAGMVFVAPILLYGIISGKVSEFSGFGISTKTTAAAMSPVIELSTKIDSIKILSPKEDDFQRAALLDACENYFIVRPSLIPSEERAVEYYISNATYAIRSSVACGEFLGLIVLDEKDRYLGSFGKSFFYETLASWAIPKSSSPISAKEFSERVLSMTIFGASLQYPVESIGPGEGVEAAINMESSLIEAFNSFRHSNIDFLVLTDEMGRFKGVVRYRDLVEEILASILVPRSNN